MTVRSDLPKIVSAHWDVADAHTLDGYVRLGGYEGLRRALAMQPNEVVDIVTGATVQGRGGAGFPAGNKWHFLDTAAFPHWIVVNGDESEPGTHKDRTLMERDPHQLIEGSLIAAYACKASQIFLYVRGEMAFAQERVAAAINEAYANNYAGKNILGTDFSVDITLHWGAGAYIVGDETALLESLEGKRGMPRPKPPYFPAVMGLYMNPTIVNNVETLSNLPWIMVNGAEAFAAIGSEKSNGTRLIAVSGHVKRPGTYEVECGVVTFRDVFYDESLGGGIRDDNELKAFIPGGGSAPWFFPEHLDMALDPTLVGPA
ncbi:MAG: NADH-quinone oxidoreductase subunit, partial [Actinomycetota bacterium]